jgi:hypothetical protein
MFGLVNPWLHIVQMSSQLNLLFHAFCHGLYLYNLWFAWNFKVETNLENEMIKSTINHILHLHFTTMQHAMEISIKINFIIVAIQIC